MRISLLLFTCLCLAGSAQAQSFIRLKNIQLGPSFSIQNKSQDDGVYDLAPIIKDPQRFPNWSIDNMPSRWLFRPQVPIGGHASLLTTWDFYNRNKKKYSDNKEWKIGAEYFTFIHKYRSFRNSFRTASYEEKERSSFQRRSQHLGIYSDFVFKNHLPKRSSAVYYGVGGYLAYTVSGSVKEWRNVFETGQATTTERYSHHTYSRRDIALLFPIGFEICGSRSMSRLGLNMGTRPGVVLIKEKMLPVFASPVIGFTMRIVYNLH